MNGKGLWGGLKAVVVALLVVILFPLVWMRSLRLARRHTDVDPRGPAKVGIAIVVSVLILAGGAYKLVQFEEKATDGIYASLDRRISVAVGESEYQDKVSTVEAANVALPIIQKNLADAKANGDAAKAKDLQEALNATEKQKSDAQARANALARNDRLYQDLQPAVARHDDAAILSAISGSGITDPATMQHNVDGAFAEKARDLHDMTVVLGLFVWPSLFGAFFAPVVFAVGSILSRAFVPSDTVGFKPYPAGAAGFFLLLGAFGLPSIPFAAWVFHDMEGRSLEGQIAL